MEVYLDENQCQALSDFITENYALWCKHSENYLNEQERLALEATLSDNETDSLDDEDDDFDFDEDDEED